jgi:hypothetical protein
MARRLPAPCLSVCVDEHFFARRLGFVPERPVTALEYQRLVYECRRRLARPDAAMPELLQRCLSHPNVQPKHVSFMSTRAPPTVKLDLRIGVEYLASFLEAIGWPESAPDLVASVRRFMPWDGAVQVNLVVEPGMAPPLEVELLTQAGEVGEQERTDFLDRLVVSRLCCAEKARALMDIWRSPLVARQGDLPVARNWYVKLRLHPTGPVDAKAYLAMMPRQRME